MANSASLPLIVGDLFAAAAVPVLLQGSLEAVLQVVEAVAGASPVWASAQLPAVLGESVFRASSVVGASTALGPVLGVTRARAACVADMWSAAGFPAPRIAGYQYSKDAGLVRTKFYAGNTRQRRRWRNGRRTLNATFEILKSDLYAVETFIAEIGFRNWFTIGLVTGDNLSPVLRMHVARIKEDPSVKDIYGLHISVSLTLEVQ